MASEDPEKVFDFLVKTIKENYDETVVGFNQNDKSVCNPDLMKLNLQLKGKSNTNTDWTL